MDENNYTENDTVILEDEDGNEQEYVILDAIETDEARYIALTPIFDDPDECNGDIFVMRVEKDDEGEVLVAVDDDQEFDEISQIFEERLAEQCDWDIEQDDLDVEQDDFDPEE